MSRSRSFRRERSVHEASSNNVWADSGPTLVAQEAGNSSNCPDNGITLGNTVDLQPSLPVEHFGTFDSGEAVFSDSHNNSVLPSPQNLEIQDALNETSDSNPTLLIPNRPSDDSCSSSLPKETTVNE